MTQCQCLEKANVNLFYIFYFSIQYFLHWIILNKHILLSSEFQVITTTINRNIIFKE